MNRRTHVLLLAGVALVSGAGGCGRDNRGSVALTALCFPLAPDTTGSCPMDAKCGQVLANGALFVDLQTSGFTLQYPIQLDNQRPDNTDLASGRTNTNFALVERFDMKYLATGFSLPAATASQTVTVPSNGSTVAMVELIPFSVGQVLAAALPAGPTDVIVKVSAHGRYGDDTQFDTADYSVPVSVTQGLVGPFTCAAGKVLVGVCPQQGQTAVTLCQ